ncbi:TonB-dependent siderophore receptor [Roseomonas populi]|uniref:TonB-dependent siderophore receptor n=1 Tax=Roseomonas populi TaxID=3121582 RepID=A0ABT1WZE2_9PROT|nr:TonB-dependent siderophore receptor [Roseomonas pecuniae]MCR0981221.1 TonB-dependent siderophore receptor [Roseomonas pecuniae]
MSATALTTVALSAAMAQDAPDTLNVPTVDVAGSAERALDPVRGFVARQEISGTKTDTPLIENPQSVSVVPRDQIDARQAQTLGEALRYTAGVRVENFGTDSRTDWFQIRGFNAQDNGIFLNGLRYNTGFAGNVYETYGLERYEILRGPTSVLYGQIAPGGLVNMVSRRPTDTAQGEVRLTAGSFGRAQAQATTSGPLTADGVWSYSLTALGRKSETAVDFTRDDRAFVAPALTFRPDANTSLTVLGYYQQDSTSGNQFLPYTGTVRPTPFGRISRERFTGEQDFDKYARTQLGTGYEFSHRFNNVLSFQQNARYSHTDISWNQVFGGGLQPDQRTLNRFAFQADIGVSTFQVDNQLRADFTTGPLTHTVLGGFDYSYVTYRNGQGSTGFAGLDLFSPVYGTAPIPSIPQFSNVRQNTSQYGIYAQDQIRWGQLVLLGGIRQDFTYADTRNRLTEGNSYQYDGKFTWRVGAIYLFESGIAPYVSYARSFQPQIGTDARGVTFEPLEGEQYEAGIKFQPNGMRSFVQASAFQLTQRNTLTTDPGNVVNQIAVGQVRVRGLELEAVAELGNGVTLTGSYTYLDPEITRSGNPDELGNRPNGVPRNTAGLYGEYTFVNAAGPLSGLTLGAGVRYLGNTTSANTNYFVVPAATLFDATMRYDLEKLSPRMRGLTLAVNASNLGDTRYVSRCSTNDACFYGNRLNVLGSVSYRW